MSPHALNNFSIKTVTIIIYYILIDFLYTLYITCPSIFEDACWVKERGRIILFFVSVLLQQRNVNNLNIIIGSSRNRTHSHRDTARRCLRGYFLIPWMFIKHKRWGILFCEHLHTPGILVLSDVKYTVNILSVNTLRSPLPTTIRYTTLWMVEFNTTM